jgi:hypothetical protein
MIGRGTKVTSRSLLPHPAAPTARKAAYTLADRQRFLVRGDDTVME